MLKVAGLQFDPKDFDDKETEQQLTTLAELLIMVRDNRAFSTDLRAAELYNQFFVDPTVIDA
jgi:hypothetical protein